MDSVDVHYCHKSIRSEEKKWGGVWNFDFILQKYFIYECLKVRFLVSITIWRVGGSNQRHLQTILLYLTSVLSEKSENLYKTFLEPVEPEKQGFRTNRDRKVDETQL